MLDSPTDFLQQHSSWLAYLTVAIVAWLSREGIGALLTAFSQRRKTNADADGQTINNLDKSGDILQKIFSKLSRAEDAKFAFECQVRELRDQLKREANERASEIERVREEWEAKVLHLQNQCRSKDESMIKMEREMRVVRLALWLMMRVGGAED